MGVPIDEREGTRAPAEGARVSSSVRARLEARVRAHPLVAKLDVAVVDAIIAAGIYARFKPGEHLSREGDEVRFYWMLLEGTVRVYYRSASGIEVTVKIFAAPAAWAEMQILTQHTHTEDAVCVEPVWCMCVPSSSFQRLLDAHPSFMRHVLEDTSARFLIAAQNERALAFLTVPERLAHVLLSYVRVYGEDVVVDGGAGVFIATRLSHEQLAADLGVVKKSVTRTLSQWTDEGIIEKSGQSYVVRKLPALIERSPKGLIGVDWSTGTEVRRRQVDDDDADVARPKKRRSPL